MTIIQIKMVFVLNGFGSVKEEASNLTLNSFSEIKNCTHYPKCSVYINIECRHPKLTLYYSS